MKIIIVYSLLVFLFPTSVFCQDTAFTVTEVGDVYKTHTGGTNWFKVGNVGSLNPSMDICMIDINEGFVITQNGALYKTLDGGATWQYQNITGSVHNHSEISMINADTGMVIAGGGYIYKTTFGGAHWTWPGNTILPNSSSRCISMIDANIAFVTETDGVIWKTIDGGISWTNPGSTGYQAPFKNHEGISMINDKIGYIITLIGDCLKTIDGGITWVVTGNTGANTGPSYNIFHEDISMANINDGYVMKRSGTIYRTKNGGVTWTADNTNSTDNHNGISVPLSNLSVAVKENSTSKFNKIFPNPTLGRVQISAPQFSTITIKNVLGQVLFFIDSTPPSNLELDLTAYPKGLYLISVETNGIVTSSRLVKL